MTVKLNEDPPDVNVGVPEMTPVEVFIVMPPGRDPLVTLNAKGAKPPVTASGYE